MKIHFEQMVKTEKFNGRKSDLVDSGFVKTCNELVIGLQFRWPQNQLRQIQLPKNQLPQTNCRKTNCLK